MDLDNNDELAGWELDDEQLATTFGGMAAEQRACANQASMQSSEM